MDARDVTGEITCDQAYFSLEKSRKDTLSKRKARMIAGYSRDERERERILGNHHTKKRKISSCGKDGIFSSHPVKKIQ